MKTISTLILSYTTIKPTTKPAEVIMPEEDTQTNMEYDAILHYLKLAVNFNNSADTKDANKDENTSPTPQEIIQFDHCLQLIVAI